MRVYHVVAINDRRGRKDYLTAWPVNHDEACTILRKQTPPRFQWCRAQLEECPSQQGGPYVAPNRYEVTVWSGIPDKGPIKRYARETFDEARDCAQLERAKLTGDQFVTVFDALGGVVMLKYLKGE